MNLALIVVSVFLVLLIFVALAVVGVYNTLVTLRNLFRNGFSQIDVQLKRRHDLIPNLVETAKGYMAHERGTLEAVINARAKATQANVQLAANPNDPNAIRTVMQAESGLSGALGRLMVVSENYPQLKADVTMKQLMDELASTENRIAFARQGYNDGVLQYNNAREVFPNIFVANIFGFVAADFFKIETEAERIAPKVSF
jgi:LemA protein